MKAFFAAIALMVAITAAAPSVLGQMGFSAADASAGSSVRLD